MPGGNSATPSPAPSAPSSSPSWTDSWSGPYLLAFGLVSTSLVLGSARLGLPYGFAAALASGLTVTLTVGLTTMFHSQRLREVRDSFQQVHHRTLGWARCLAHIRAHILAQLRVRAFVCPRAFTDFDPVRGSWAVAVGRADRAPELRTSANAYTLQIRGRGRFIAGRFVAGFLIGFVLGALLVTLDDLYFVGPLAGLLLGLMFGLVVGPVAGLIGLRSSGPLSTRATLQACSRGRFIAGGAVAGFLIGFVLMIINSILTDPYIHVDEDMLKPGLLVGLMFLGLVTAVTMGSSARQCG